MNRNVWVLCAVAMFAVLIAAGAYALVSVPRQGADNRQAIEQAIADNDYTTWKSLMEEQLTEDRFNQLVTMYTERTQMQSSEQAVRDAISTGDYDSYVAAVKELTSAQVMSESDFNTLVELKATQGDAGNATMPHDQMGPGFARGMRMGNYMGGMGWN